MYMLFVAAAAGIHYKYTEYDGPVVVDEDIKGRTQGQ